MIRENDQMETTCRKLAPLLLKAADGELSLQERSTVETHLAFCEACAAEARDLGKIGDQIRLHAPSGARLPSGARMAARIVEKEASRAPGPRHLRLTPARLAVAGTALALAVGTWQVNRPTGHPPPAPAPDAAAAAPEPPPMLFVVDDEEEGRRVMLAATGDRTARDEP